MAKREQEHKKGGNCMRRAHTKYKTYRDHKICLKNKIKRILKSNGIQAAKQYAKKNEIPLPKGGTA